MSRFLRKLLGSKVETSAAPQRVDDGDTDRSSDDHWARVEAAREAAGRSHAAFADALSEILFGCHPETIASFDQWLLAQCGRAARWDLWGAAYVINGGCSDDGFIDFRYGLVSQGRATFEAALADPDSLAGLELALDEEEGLFFESLGSVAHEAYEQRMGRELDAVVQSEEILGVAWDEADLPRLFPKLTARYGG